jgi:hypothetical protein
MIHRQQIVVGFFSTTVPTAPVVKVGWQVPPLGALVT